MNQEENKNVTPDDERAKSVPNPLDATAPTSYERIKSYSERLKEYISKNGIPLGLSKFPYYIKMDVATGMEEGIGRMLDDLKDLEECKKIICVLGLGSDASGQDEFKVSFLGLDKDGNVDKRHYQKKSPIEGEETWPPEDTFTNPGTNLLP